MSFDTTLADRVRKRLGKRTGLTEKKMFGLRPRRGSMAFLLNGNMRYGVHGKEMIVRIDLEETAAALKDCQKREVCRIHALKIIKCLTQPAG